MVGLRSVVLILNKQVNRMARWCWLLSAALAASMTWSVATAQAQEEDDNAAAVSIDDVPAPVQDAILSHVGAGILAEVVKTTEQNGEPVYKARIRHDGRVITVRVDASGHVLDVHSV